MAKTVYVARSNYLDVPKVFGNVKALYDFAIAHANSETPTLDRQGKAYPSTYSRFNTQLKKQGFTVLYTDNSLSADNSVKVDTTTINGGWYVEDRLQQSYDCDKVDNLLCRGLVYTSFNNEMKVRLLWHY